MSLYVRLSVGFWTHRKTLRLRAALGDAAYLLPLRLWTYAAENQPNGDFSDYSPQELALLVAYTGDAQAMLEALQRAGFMDGMKLHGWQEHNAFHAVFSRRASTAAMARWHREGPYSSTKKSTVQEKKRKEKSEALLQASPKHGLSIATSNATSILSHGKAKPKNEQEIEAFCLSIGLTKLDAEYFWNHWVSNGFKNKGQAIRDWKATIRAWKAAGHCPSQDAQRKNGQTDFLSATERRQAEIDRANREYRERKMKENKH